MNEQTILFTHKNGDAFVLTPYKNRVRVDLRLKNIKQAANTYRFDKTALYEHPYLSWENLYYCAMDGEYLSDRAVQEHKKLVSQRVWLRETAKRNELEELERELPGRFDMNEVNLSTRITKFSFATYRLEAIITRKGCLNDYFDHDEILETYEKHGIYLPNGVRSRFDYFWNIPLCELFTHKGTNRHGFDFLNIHRMEDFMINGLGLGYPIESTVSIIKTNFPVMVKRRQEVCQEERKKRTENTRAIRKVRESKEPPCMEPEDTTIPVVMEDESYIESFTARRESLNYEENIFLITRAIIESFIQSVQAPELQGMIFRLDQFSAENFSKECYKEYLNIVNDEAKKSILQGPCYYAMDESGTRFLIKSTINGEYINISLYKIDKDGSIYKHLASNNDKTLWEPVCNEQEQTTDVKEEK